MRNIPLSIFIVLTLILGACGSKPKVIEAESSGDTEKPIFQDGQAAVPGLHPVGQSDNGQQHAVVIEEVLNTEKYSYLRVKENNEEKWLAIVKQEVKIGGNYVYTGGLIQRNFQSREFNRVFDTVYLVSDFRPAGDSNAAQQGVNIPSSTESLEPPKDVKRPPGAIKISDLVANLGKYEGKTVAVTGKVVKLNPMIMGRNWVHLQDGSGKNFDLTVTTTDNVALGSIVTLEGTIALKKDFGAGYKYDYIMESAVLK